MKKMYTQLRMSSQEEVEEVIYSEGEAFEEIYPDNTWDSDDALCDDVSFSMMGLTIRMFSMTYIILLNIERVINHTI